MQNMILRSTTSLFIIEREARGKVQEESEENEEEEEEEEEGRGRSCIVGSPSPRGSLAKGGRTDKANKCD